MNQAKRPLCDRCHYTIQNCLCEHIQVINNRTQLMILQHPSEVKNAKNTARLAQLCFANCEVYIGETEDDFSQLRNTLNAHSALLYPSDDAILLNENNAANHHISQLILIDGTWKKAHKILQLNPWLTQLPAVSFATLPKNQYHIRKAPRADSLSTLEAAAFGLAQLEQADIQPAYDLLAAMMEQQFKHMPEHVRKRYQSP